MFIQQPDKRYSRIRILVGVAVACTFPTCGSDKNTPPAPEGGLSTGTNASPNATPPGETSGSTKPDTKEPPPTNSWVIGGEPDGDSPAGRWGRPRESKIPSAINPWQKEQFDQAEALGYVQGSKKAVSAGGITRFNRKKAGNGLNFYTSGHAPVAVLMDMNGKVLHQWEYPFDKAWPSFPEEVDPVHSLFWRRAHLYPNGDLLAIFEGLGMIKIDKESTLLWKSALKEHHDVTVNGNGDIYTLTRTRSIHPDINPNQPIVADFLTVLSPEGNVKKRISLIEAMKKSPSAMQHWDRSKFNKGDIFHTNTVQILDGRAASLLPAFQAGRVLISSYTLNTLFVVDLDEEKVVWDFSADFVTQHDAQILPNRNLLLLDNHGGDNARGGSRVLEYKLPDMQQVWSYEGTRENKFGTPSCGTVERLKNGNTLIAETDNGRAFEVTAEGEIVWEFISPHRAGVHNELVASLFQLDRFPKSYARWLK